MLRFGGLLIPSYSFIFPSYFLHTHSYFFIFPHISFIFLQIFFIFLQHSAFKGGGGEVLRSRVRNFFPNPTEAYEIQGHVSSYVNLHISFIFLQSSFIFFHISPSHISFLRIFSIFLYTYLPLIPSYFLHIFQHLGLKGGGSGRGDFEGKGLQISYLPQG